MIHQPVAILFRQIDDFRDELEPVDHAAGRDAALARQRPPARDDRHLEPESTRLRDPLGQVAHPAQLTGQADLPDSDGATRRWGAQVGARDRDIPEWRIAVIPDAPSEFAHQFMYPAADLRWVTRSVGCRLSIARVFSPVSQGPAGSDP